MPKPDLASDAAGETVIPSAAAACRMPSFACFSAGLSSLDDSLLSSSFITLIILYAPLMIHSMHQNLLAPRGGVVIMGLDISKRPEWRQFKGTYLQFGCSSARRRRD